MYMYILFLSALSEYTELKLSVKICQTVHIVKLYSPTPTEMDSGHLNKADGLMEVKPIEKPSSELWILAT